MTRHNMKRPPRVLRSSTAGAMLLVCTVCACGNGNDDNYFEDARDVIVGNQGKISIQYYGEPHGVGFRFSDAQQVFLGTADDPTLYDFKCIRLDFQRPAIVLGAGVVAADLGSEKEFEAIASPPEDPALYQADVFDPGDPGTYRNPAYEQDLDGYETHGDYYINMAIGDRYDDGGIPGYGRYQNHSVFVLKTAKGFFAKIEVLKTLEAAFWIHYHYWGTPLHPPRPTPAAVVLTAPKPVVPVGGELPFLATAVYSSGADEDITLSDFVTWHSSDAAVGGVDPASGSFAGKAPGATQVTARMFDVTSNAIPMQVKRPVRVEVRADRGSLQVGDTMPLRAVVHYEDASADEDPSPFVRWSSSRPEVGTIFTHTGFFEALGEGETGITASVGTLESEPFPLRVEARVLLDSIVVHAPETVVPVGADMQFEATGVFSDGSRKNLTRSLIWRSSNPEAGSVAVAEGLFTGRSQGAATVQALSLDNVASDEVPVDVAVMTPRMIRVDAPETTHMPVGASRAFQAAATYGDAWRYDVTRSVAWSSSDAGVVSFTGAGLLTAERAGTAQVRVFWKGLEDVVEFVVHETYPERIEIEAPSLVLPLGTSMPLTARGAYAGGETWELTNAVAWLSSHPAVAWSDGPGRLRGEKAGAASVTASWHGAQSPALEISVLSSEVHVCRDLTLWFKDSFQGDLLPYGRAFRFSNVIDQEVQGVVEDPAVPSAYDFRVVMWWDHVTQPCLHIGSGAAALNLGSDQAFDDVLEAPEDAGQYQRNRFEGSDPVYGLNPDYRIDPLTDRETGGDYFTGMVIGDSFDEGGLPWPVGRFMTGNVYVIRTADGHVAKLEVLAAAAGEFTLRYAYQRVPGSRDLDTRGLGLP